MTCILILFISFSAGTIAKSINEVNDAKPLDLTAYLERGEADKARKLSTVDPTLFAGVQSHAAYFNVNKTNKWHTFFWFFPAIPAQNKPLDSTPWIIWLQGGPGASSLYGLFEEIGPLQFENGTASRMPVTWNSNYSLLFIDNPIGVGFSYSETKNKITNEDEVGRTLTSFIQQFVQVFPEMQKAPLFIAGESYAGKYVPAFGYYLLHHRNTSIPINFKGLVIADGWTDPLSMLHYSELGMQLGFWDFDQAAKLKVQEDAVRKAWNDGNIKLYNYVRDKWNESCPFEQFLSHSKVRSALHVGDRQYSGWLNYDVYCNYFHEKFLSVKPWLEDLLEHQYAVLCYNGQLDYAVGYALSEHMYRSLKWSGAKDFLKAPRLIIQSEHPSQTLNPIGYVKTAGNFMEVLIRSAGHMAPADQPLATKQVIDMFIARFK